MNLIGGYTVPVGSRRYLRRIQGCKTRNLLCTKHQTTWNKVRLTQFFFWLNSPDPARTFAHRYSRNTIYKLANQKSVTAIIFWCAYAMAFLCALMRISFQRLIKLFCYCIATLMWMQHKFKSVTQKLLHDHLSSLDDDTMSTVARQILSAVMLTINHFVDLPLGHTTSLAGSPLQS